VLPLEMWARSNPPATISSEDLLDLTDLKGRGLRLFGISFQNEKRRKRFEAAPVDEKKSEISVFADGGRRSRPNSRAR